MLQFYEEDIKFLESKCNEDIIFQQDGASRLGLGIGDLGLGLGFGLL